MGAKPPTTAIVDYSGGVIKDAKGPVKIKLTCKQYTKVFGDPVIGEKEASFPEAGK